jgi:hypothetical protein
MTDTTGVFTFTCRIGTEDRQDGGITVGPYSMKCDVIIDATNYWSTATAAGLCPNNKRFVGLLAYVATADATIDVSATINNNQDAQGQGYVDFNDGKSFLKWKKTFEDGASGSSYDVNAQQTDVTDNTNLPAGTGAVTKLIFSFLSPKSVTNVFVWDPELGIDITKVDSSASPVVASYLLAVMLGLLALVY